jgi:transcriptional regulator with XRE-family HTH domain
VEKSISSELYKEIIFALVELRKSAGLTQRGLAARLQREPSFVAKVELGERRVDLLEFYRICKVCKQKPSVVILRLIKRFEGLDRGRNRHGMSTGREDGGSRS